MKGIPRIIQNVFNTPVPTPKARVSCRGIVISDGKLLLSYESKKDVYMSPGGGLESGEAPEECCVREIKEETGLDVTLIDGFREVSVYCPFGKIRKRVVFFLARAFTDNVKIQEEEIDSYIP
jgi:ADP-ribose pyrophosphatase YjhB (NUDIX family)